MYIYNSLKYFNTLRLNISCNKILKLSNFKHIKQTFYLNHKKKIPTILIGEGSNIFFLNNFEGIVIINNIKGIKVTQNINFWFLHIGSGEKWAKVVDFTIYHGINGLENLSFIPGLIGSAVVNNIGAYGLEISRFLYYLKILNVFTGKIFYLLKKKIFFNYRDSFLKKFNYNNFIVLKVGLRINKQWKPYLLYPDLSKRFCVSNNKIKIEDIYYALYKIRLSKIPNINKFGNLGSFFQNPIFLLNSNVNFKIFDKIKEKNVAYIKIKHLKYKIFAASLIERCSLKNFCIGDACVYEKQPLIIINKGNALPEDVYLLVKLIIEKVFLKFNILLKLEVKIIDFISFDKNFNSLYKKYILK